MSSKDDPSGSDGRTVIRGSPRRAPRQDQAPPPLPQPPASDPTIIYSGSLEQQMPASATVIYQSSPFGERPDDTARNNHKQRNRAATEPGTSQEALFEAAERVQVAGANPLMSAATPLLILFGHLRTVTVETDTAVLAQHVAESIEEFEWKAAEAGVAEDDVHIAKYALSETADDIVANLPGIGPEIWAQHGMLSRFYGIDGPGNGFFEALNSVLADPAERGDLLELLHACMSLGFQGPYRGVAGGERSLELVRQDIYAALRYFRPLVDDGISPRWQGLAASVSRRPYRVPLWAIGAFALALVTAAFFWMRDDVTRDGDTLAATLLALTPATPVVIERTDFAPPVEHAEPVEKANPVEAAPTMAQIYRIRAALAQDIGAGGLTVATKGEFIVVELNNELLFEPGKAETRSEFAPVAARVAAAFANEPGSIKIVGHTDNVKPRQSSAYKSNYDLSVARAEAVAKALAPGIGDASRMTVEGKGEDVPIADNATADGRALNRRVDVMIRREGAS
ncbi:type VI secretion system protein ImpK [Aminobacter aminovorans]|uniref:Outer membrane protein OmpAb n=1 Tax=Aminobacter aminovorans TaxID=83263 RepID=A0A380WP53_AMIAI|nr:type VI secretion system protein TssL, long form [Aminobacter aminovorans]TCS27643.1 type VI secretion system protein ImpK [Aminobacter aminovorans]SUU89944.1 Outer membrane protein OmpAb [Aminobacter aminovorans]